MTQAVKIAVLTDATDSVRGFDKAGRAAQDAGRKFDGAAEGADTVASKGAQAAGAMAGLGDLIGGKFGGAMTVAGVGMQAAADAGDLLNVAIEGGAKVASKAAGFVMSLGKAETYAAAARKVSAGAQWALNTAMNANPIALVIAAVVALVAIFVVAYKKSETFRNIVNGAFAGVKRAAGVMASFFTQKIPAAFSKVIGWVKGNWPKILAILTGPIGIAVLVIAKNWDKIKAGAGRAKDWIVDKWNALIGFFKSIPGRISSATSGMWDGVKNSFKSVINTVIGWWNNFSLHIDIPDAIPGLPDSFTINTPNIPYLAKGGIVTRPTLAVIGEAGPEAVIPLGRGGGIPQDLHVTITLTAEQVTALERGRRIEADRKVYLRNGGKAAS